MLASCGSQDEEPVVVKSSKKANTTAASSTLHAAIEGIRHSIPDGQVILADDPAFAKATGWCGPEYDQTHDAKVTQWTTGDHQVLDWEGPETPGDYQFRAMFWRTHPFPQRELEVPYLLPGEKDWRTLKPPMESVVFEGPIKTTQSREKLHVEFKIPSWEPAKLIPGSPDPRKIGFIFIRIEVSPAKKAESAGNNPEPNHP